MPSQMIKSLAKPGVNKESDKYLDGNCNYDIDIQILSSNPQPSTLSVQKSSGEVSISLNEPVIMDFKKLVELVDNNAKNDDSKLTNHPVLKRLLNAMHVSCNAFYYKSIADKKESDPAKQAQQDKEKKDATVFLIEFALEFHEDKDDKKEEGLISALTGCPEVANLFDVRGVSVSVVKGTEDDYSKYLQPYAAQLVAAGKPTIVLPNPEEIVPGKAQGGQPGGTQGGQQEVKKS